MAITCKNEISSLASLALLALLTVASCSPALAMPDKEATASMTTVAETAVVPADAANGAANKGNNHQTDWQPPVAPRVVIPSPVDPEQAKRLAKEWGVKLISLKLTASGIMMDFRFRVLDAEKALSLFDSRIKPYLVVERTGVKLPVPMADKVGALRPTNRGKNIKADKNYYMLFANPDRHVKPGEKVTMVIGDFKVKNLAVY